MAGIRTPKLPLAGGMFKLTVLPSLKFSLIGVFAGYLSNGLLFFEICSLITATMFAYKLNNARK